MNMSVCSGFGTIINSTCFCDPGHFGPTCGIDVTYIGSYGDSVYQEIIGLMFAMAFGAFLFEMIYALAKEEHPKFSLFYALRLNALFLTLVGTIAYSNRRHWEMRPESDIALLTLKDGSHLLNFIFIIVHWMMTYYGGAGSSSRNAMIIAGIAGVIAYSGSVGLFVGWFKTFPQTGYVIAYNVFTLCVAAIASCGFVIVGPKLWARVRECNMDENRKNTLLRKLLWGTISATALLIFHQVLVFGYYINFAVNFVGRVETLIWLSSFAQGIEIISLFITCWLVRPAFELNLETARENPTPKEKTKSRYESTMMEDLTIDDV